MSETTEPIACSLDAGSLEVRMGEWRAFVAASVQTIDADARSVRLVLEDTDRALLAAAELGQREKACCRFFDVSIDLGTSGRVLSLRVPGGAEAVLAEFVAELR